MDKQLLIATHNKGKIIEIKEIFGTKLPYKLISLNDLNITADIAENGSSFAENALIKAKFFYNISKIPTIADDSGVFIAALENELGLKTRRWGAGEKATDAEWIDYFLNRMAPEKDKTADFISTAAFYDGHQSKTFEGKTNGTITEQLEAEYLPGLPLSAVFKPIGYDQVFSKLSIDQKNKISHRGKAFQKLLEFLNNYL